MIGVLARLMLIGACGFGLLWIAMIGMTYPLILVGLLILAAYRYSKRYHGSSWSHGQARFADLTDLLSARLLGNRGLILGRAGETGVASRWAALNALFSPYRDSATVVLQFLASWQPDRWVRHRLIRLGTYVHLATFAPTGRGKSVALLVPNLLAVAKNCVVFDPKGELYKLTAEHRRKRFGHRIICVDPFGVCVSHSDSLNPLCFIDCDSPDFLDQCRDVANMLVLRTGKEIEKHWTDAAELVLTAFIAFVCACEPDSAQRHLGLVRMMVSSREKFLAAIEAMRQSDAAGGVVQRLGDLCSWFQDRELASVLTTTNRMTQFLDSPAVAANVESSSFDPLLLRSGKCTVYLCLPSSRLVTMSALSRSWIGTILRVITRGEATERNDVLFLIDEAAHIGKIAALEDAVTLMRGMGVRIWLFFQSLAQLSDCYGDKAPAILDNLDTQIYMGTNSYQTAEEISRRMGDTTITVRSRNDSRGRSWQAGSTAHGTQPSTSDNRGDTFNDIGRRLMKPEEIMAGEEALIFHRNLPPIRATLVRYFADKEFQRGRCGQSGFHGSPPHLAMIAFCWLAMGIMLSLPLYFLTGCDRIFELPSFSGRLSTAADYPLPQPLPPEFDTPPFAIDPRFPTLPRDRSMTSGR